MIESNTKSLAKEYLKNEDYIGNLTQGRKKRINYKIKKEIRTPKENWIIVENTHEPIIDKETYDLVQNIYEKKIKPSDTIDIESIEFVTEACYGSKDIVFFKFGDMVFESINMYDGNFVITYSAYPICDGLDLTEQYRTEEMDRKYENKELRENAKIYYEEPEEKTLDVNQALSLLKEFNG